MQSPAILPVDFSRRTVLPPSARVVCPPFRDDDHERARIIRECNDLFDLDRLPLTPRPQPVVDELSICMAGAVVTQTRRLGSAEVVQTFTATGLGDVAVDEPVAELAVMDDTPSPAFERAPTLADEAGAALAALNLRRVANTRRVAYEPAKAPSVWPYVVGVVALVVSFTVLWSALR